MYAHEICHIVCNARPNFLWYRLTIFSFWYAQMAKNVLFIFLALQNPHQFFFQFTVQKLKCYLILDVWPLCFPLILVYVRGLLCWQCSRFAGRWKLHYLFTLQLSKHIVRQQYKILNFVVIYYYWDYRIV